MKVCEACGNEYERIGHHWAAKTEHRPNLMDKQKEILTGIVMGDGWINEGVSCNLSCSMTTKEYLQYIDNIMGILSTGVRLKSTAKESCEHAIEVGTLGSGGGEEDYSDIYRLRTRTHPFFDELRNWYSTGSKTFPEDLELTPSILKHWFVCDGCWNNNGSYDYITIGVSNEYDNKEKLNSYFDDIGIEIGSFNTGTREDDSKFMNLIFNRDSTDKFFEYIGRPVPGFEYKFPERNGENLDGNAFNSENQYDYTW